MSTRRKVIEERLYYSPPAMRKQNEQMKLKSSSSSLPERKGLESGSNLDRFLEYTAPVVPAQHFSRTSMKSWKNRDSDFHPYFIFGDLWESFRERSFYGAGVPLVLNGSGSIVQYYVPSLSGIQLYVDPSIHVAEQSGRPGEDSDANSSRETSSEGDSECGSDRQMNSMRRSWNQQSSRHSGRSSSRLGSLVDGDDISNPPGVLVFEYFEKELPFHREPLADKLSTLASHCPGLKTYKSCDLTPSSWISIAWYPIYRIPIGETLQNVDACFLTFHSLSKPVRGGEGMHEDAGKLSLPAFGLISHKFKVSDWNVNGVYEAQKADSLARAADNWLRLLQVDHPDYSFFMSHNTYWR